MVSNKCVLWAFFNKNGMLLKTFEMNSRRDFNLLMSSIIGLASAARGHIFVFTTCNIIRAGNKKIIGVAKRAR